MNKFTRLDKVLLCLIAIIIMAYTVALSAKLDKRTAYIQEWNESSQYARLSCNNFRAPVMVYRIETDRRHAILGGGWWRYGFTTDGQPLAGCVAA